MQGGYATTPNEPPIPQSHVVGIKGIHDGNSSKHAFGSVQCFGLQLPPCYAKIPTIAHMPSEGMHQSLQSSLRFVAPFGALDDCRTHVLGHAIRAYAFCGNNHEGAPVP